jgi:hypothetical protein
MLRTVDWYLATFGISLSVASSTVKQLLALEDGTDRLSRNVVNYQPMFRDIPEGRTYLDFGESP